jgi:D-sedoheptulose 7-phosphate isomerase
MIDTDNFESCVRRSIQESIAVKRLLLRNNQVLSVIAKVSELLVSTFRRGNKMMLFGNGGSAADAQHIAAEFVGRFAFDRPALPALALNANSSSITAIGNDYGFDLVFSRQIEALACGGDIAVGISTSGQSANVTRAMSTAKKIGLHTVGLTGLYGIGLKELVDYCICVPSTRTSRIQECHTLIGHIIAELVEQTIFQNKAAVATNVLSHMSDTRLRDFPIRPKPHDLA